MNKQVNNRTAIDLEEKQAEIVLKIEATLRAVKRILFSDFGSFDTNSEQFLVDYKNGVAELQIIESALILVSKQAEEVYEVLAEFEMPKESGTKI